MQKTEKLVSVIICVYNGEKYIASSLNSVLNQTYKNIEVIVVNDGSTDHTEEIALAYPNIKYIYQQNQGVAVARNTGLRQCTGDYIAWLDSDDLYLPTKIQEQVSFIESNDADIAYNDVILIDEFDNEIKQLRCEYEELEPEDFISQLLFRQIMPCLPTLMYKRKCFENIAYKPQMKYAEDYWMIIQLAQKYKFVYMKKILYKYRRHSNNLTNNKQAQENMEIQVIEDLGIDRIRDIVNKSSLEGDKKNLLLGKIFIKIKNYEESKKALENISKYTKIDYLKNFYLGNVYYLETDYVTAVKYYEKAISIEGNRAEAHNNLGAAMHCLGLFDEARICFSKALEIQSNYLDAKDNIKNTCKSGEVKITVRELRKNLMLY